jgi:ribonuclease HI
LINISEKFARDDKLKFYTDGSVKNIASKNMKMGLGWIKTNDEHNCHTFKAAIEDWPSSTKAELIALITAIITAKLGSEIQIVCDSSALIQGFRNNVTNNNMNIRKTLKENNFILWSITQYIIKKLKLKIKFTKVKAHSGIEYNELADMLAKEGCENEIISFNYEGIKKIKYTLSFENKVIEKSCRTFIKEYIAAKGFHEWLSNNRNKKYKTLNLSKEISWEATTRIQKNPGKNNITNYEQSKIKSFLIKNLMEELPTIEKLKIRHPDLYKTWNCCLCNEKKETYNHVWLCKNQKELMQKIIKETQEHFNKEINGTIIIKDNKINNEPNKKNRWQVEEIENLWILEENKNKITFIDLIKGIIPQNLKDYIAKITKSDKKTLSIICDIMHNMLEKIYKEIWLKRCEITVKKEQEKKIFGKRKKKEKNTTKKINNNSRSKKNNSGITKENIDDKVWINWILYGIKYGNSWRDFYAGGNDSTDSLSLCS